MNNSNSIEELTVLDENVSELFTLEEVNDEVVSFENGTGGNNNYEFLNNLPKINDITLVGNKISRELKLQDAMDAMTNMDIENILNNQRRSI